MGKNSTFADRLVQARGTSTTVKADTPAKVVTRKGTREVFKQGGRKVYADATGRLHDAKTGAFVPGGKVTKAARKAEAKARKGKGTRKAAKATTKGSLAKGAGLTRKAWNRTFTTKVRLAGKAPSGVSYYAQAVEPAAWGEIAALRDNGATPDQAVALVLANAE